MHFLKISFYISNFILFILYLYPGSLLGCMMISDCDTQPQILKQSDFISFNHVFIFIFFSILGFLSYPENLQKIIIYLISISILLEFAQILVPIRSFQFIDLISNFLGIMVSIVILKLFNIWRSRNKNVNKIL